MEIIKDLNKMAIDLIQVFAQSCGNRLPNRIVFYRDGVSDGQFQKVLDNEVNQLKDACRGMSTKKNTSFLITNKSNEFNLFQLFIEINHYQE